MKKVVFWAMVLALGAGTLWAEDAYLESDGSAGAGINSRYFFNPRSRIEADFALTDASIQQARVWGRDSASPMASLYVQGTLNVAFGSGDTFVNSDTATMTLPDNYAVFDGNVRVRETSTALDCRKLELFGREAKPAAAPTAAELLDADPFAKVDVSRAPKAVAIGDNRELERVVASGDVDFTRQVETGTQRVTGDQAVYEVDKRELTITGKDDKRPRFYDSDATRNGVADRIVVDLATEKVHMNYSTIEFDPGKFN